MNWGETDYARVEEYLKLCSQTVISVVHQLSPQSKHHRSSEDKIEQASSIK